MQQMPTSLQRMEADDATIGGFLMRFPSGKATVVQWKHGAPSLDSKADAQKLITGVVDSLLKEGRQDDIDRTNWVSCVAAAQRIVSDWSDLLRAHIRRRDGTDDASLSTARLLT